jgi:hypothetical protein
MRSCVTYSHPKYNYNDKVKENKISRACSTHGKEKNLIQGFDGKESRKETTWKT